MKPLIELSFMPEAIASGTQTIFHYNGNITPPKNYTDWYVLVQAFATHLVDKYGIDEVSTWYFETWNEPNCGFWTGTQAEYFQLLQTTSAAIKSVDKSLAVGGPATCQSQWLPETLEFVKENNVALDFVSTHEYPTDITPTTRNTLRDVMTNARAQVGDMPLFYTEYNDGLFPQPLHDTIYASAFAIFNVIDCYGIPDMMSWWTFSDIFEEGGFNSMPFQENYGVQTIYKVAKPSFRAFELLHESGNQRAPVTFVNNATSGNATSGILVTTDSKQLMIIIYNHNVSGGVIEEESLCITIKGAPTTGDAHIRRIDETNANPIVAWENLGSPVYPTSDQVYTIVKASNMIKEKIEYTVIGANEIQFEVTMPPQGVAAITMKL